MIHINKTKCKFMMMTCIHCISILVKLVSENAAAEAKKGSTIKPWSKEEIDAIKRSLQGHINTMTCPGKGPCVEANETEPALKERDWYSVKYKAAYLLQRKRKGGGGGWKVIIRRKFAHQRRKNLINKARRPKTGAHPLDKYFA